MFEKGRCVREYEMFGMKKFTGSIQSTVIKVTFMLGRLWEIGKARVSGTEELIAEYSACHYFSTLFELGSCV
jgi:hypothetical protein